MGAVVEPGGQGVVAEAALEGGGRPLLGGVRLDHGGVDVDHQRGGGADPGGRGALAGQVPHPPPHPPPGRLEGRLDRVGVLGQGLDQPADRRVGGDRAEGLPLAAQQGQVRQVIAAQGRAQRQIRHGLARIVNRQWPAPGRQGPRQPDVQAHGPDDPGQQPRPGRPHRRNVPRLHAHSRVQPGTIHHEGAPPLGFSDIDNPHYPRTRSTLTPSSATQTMKNRG